MAGLEGAQPPIVHRDLKPSNVFVDGAGGARVADMNLSLRLHEDCLANLTGETGTYLYMSPEMMRHEVRTRPIVPVPVSCLAPAHMPCPPSIQIRGPTQPRHRVFGDLSA